MNKELFVSTTPHETKVGITEDDQLAEIYLERENEYTLAGSIYKGRVTRVLPGMQSAFVDIGLDRDAFLYVSDFMDLEQQDEDLDEAIPANRPVTEARPRPGLETDGAVDDQYAESGTVAGAGEAAPSAASSEAAGHSTDSSRDFRGRRRRRGRRGETGDRGGRGASAGRGEHPESSEIRNETSNEARSETGSVPRSESRDEPRNEPRNDQRHERFNRGDRTGRGGSDSRFQRPVTSAPRAGRDYDYGPPPGYQPILLPGESISKYQRQAPSPSHVPTLLRESAGVELPAPIAANFPEDEPIFAAEVAEPLHEQHEHESDAEV